MSQIITLANAIIKLDTAPTTNLNETTDISEFIEKFRFLNDTTSLLQVSMQQEISSVIGTSNNDDNHLSLSEFFKNILRHAEALRSIALERDA